MEKEVLFGKKLEELRRLAGLQGARVSEGQMRELFEDLELSGEQLALVRGYLKTRGIAVTGEAELGAAEGAGEGTEADGERANAAGVDAGRTEDALPGGAEEPLSGADGGYLHLYLEELEALPVYTDGERIAFAMAAMAGEASAQQSLITAYLRDVAQIARIYTGQGVAIEDLIGEGNVALSVGVTMLGSQERPEDCEGVLMKLVMDAMEEIIQESLGSSETERKALERVNKVHDAAQEYYELFHAVPTVAELAEYGHFSEKAVRDAVRISASKVDVSLE